MTQNSEIANRLRELRLKHNMEQTDVAEKMGYKSFTTISKWERGVNLPNGGKLAKLAQLFNTTTDYILFGDSQASYQSSTEITTPILAIYNQLEQPRQDSVLDYAKEQLSEQEANKVASIFSKRHDENDYINDYVQGIVAAGHGAFQEDNLYMEVKLLAEKVPEKYDTIAQVVGDSMQPLIENNDLLFIEVTSQVDMNSIGIFQINGKNFVKKLKRDYGGSWYLQSLNDSYGEIYLTDDDDIRTIGEVVGIYRED
ncbi:helix-turn-helix domain-containing protein [Streptococcus suis]